MRKHISETHIYCDCCGKEIPNGQQIYFRYGTKVGESYFSITKHTVVEVHGETRDYLDFCQECYREIHDEIVKRLKGAI